MCWTTCKKENLQKKTAKNNIKVIKILLHEDGKFISPYQHIKYRINKTYVSEIGQPIESYNSYNMFTMWNIHEGLHSYSPSVISFGVRTEKFSIRITSIEDTNVLDFWNYMSGAVIFEGIIPKGSDYYENEDGEIVSNQLKIVSVIAKIDRDLISSSDKIQALNERIHNL